MSTTTIANLNLSRNALTSLEEAGMGDEDVSRDVRRRARDEVTEDELLLQCLDGAEDDVRRDAWREYVRAIEAARVRLEDGTGEYAEPAATSIRMTVEQTEIYDNGDAPAQDDLMRKLRAEAKRLHEASGKTIEIYTADGIVADVAQ